ncbi:MAG: bifunctional DNA-formamidopyrimidine glycosylase/DNA-(apurinic or apyrimidinic site) lyase [Bdellovibrionaceae bacterium]|nr:bifunctional DNA-formamidopyrimidine glycosylase/DNA-(apurinic or apyrimidinic site) lyase [Pseudobdellovibrionaceae bacterium]MBX3033943.1 bifunctional DNA-formamidopyrimidine glycosylase/DNA-(apurinic or apyrimidinic site) lyase [Pseudobdellovibrionaceae bacterium]
MPELPEVETVRRGLSVLLQDQPVIAGFEFRRKDLRDPIPIKKIRRLEGQAIRSVLRRSKYLLFETDEGALLSHLGMTGSWRAAVPGDERGHDHFVMKFTNGLSLVYRDPRRFGILDFVERPYDKHARLRNLGPEPLEEGFHADLLWELSRSRTVPVKNFLMNAATVVGVGNIYASEALFRAGVRPQRRAHRLTRPEVERLVQTIREVLLESIRAGGSSISDYVQASGEEGLFQANFRVYDRAGEPCVVCGQQVRRLMQAGRSSYYCPKCQR